MKTVCFFCFFFLCSMLLPAQELPCREIWNGRFRTVTKETGTTLIQRRGSRQREWNRESGFRALYEITWTGECRYTLRTLKVYDRGTKKVSDRGLVTVTITSIGPSYYDYVATVEKAEGEIQGRVYVDDLKK